MADWTFPTGKDYLSPSQITSYLQCPACYKLERIDRMPTPLSIALPIGGAVHKAVETYRRVALLDAADHLDWNAYDASASDYFDAELSQSAERDQTLDLGDFTDAGKAKDEAVRLTRYVLPHIAKLDAQRGLVACELNLEDTGIASPFPFAVHGRVDALYGTADESGLLVKHGADLKSSRKQAPPGFEAALQISIYKLFLDVDWYADVLAKTKLPSFQSYVLQVPNREFTCELVMDVATRIRNGEFPARPSWACRFDHGTPSFQACVSWPEEGR